MVKLFINRCIVMNILNLNMCLDDLGMFELIIVMNMVKVRNIVIVIFNFFLDLIGIMKYIIFNIDSNKIGRIVL